MNIKNKYDDEIFFKKYSEMPRSINGLKSAGEWETFKNMMPDLEGKKILDLGCGFGWHCKYAIEKGAKEVVGIDLSKKMLSKAMEINSDEKIKYINMDIENSELKDNYYDVIISSLALHYIEDFYMMAKKIYKALDKDGVFIFSIEHPVFTAYGTEQWYTNELKEIIHWPVDNYFEEGKRESDFLGEKVIKYHKTLTTYINGLLKVGFIIDEVIEPIPTEKMIKEIAEMKNELRRPMMLLISAKK